MAFSTVLGHAVSPLPSNYLFIAYGLISLPSGLVALPFFVGRLLSHAFWRSAGFSLFDSAYYFVGYFLLSQFLLAPIIYVFTKIDWRGVFVEKRFRWS